MPYRTFSERIWSLRRKLKGWRTAIFSMLLMLVSTLDLSDILTLIPSGKKSAMMIFVIGVVVLYLRHITDTKPGWKKDEGE